MSIARNIADLFQTNGNVGIGTDSPDGQLHIKGTTNKTLKLDPTFSVGEYTTLAFARNGTDKWRVFQKNDDSYLSFFNDQTSAHQLTLKSDGNVGIGTASPAAKLHVNTGSGTDQTNTIGIERTGVTDYSGISFRTGSTVDWSIGHNNIGGFTVYENGNNSETRFIIKDGGNVGIGTTSPVGKLEVNAGTGNTFRAIRYEDHLMEIGNYNASDGYRATLYGSSEHRFMTATAGAGSGTVDMTITDGNVGIGTATPYQKLTVNTPQRSDGGTNSLGAAVIAGPISVPDHDFTNSTAIFRVQGTDATNNIQFGVGDSSYSYHGWIQASFDNTSSNGSKDLLLQPIGGDVGIGTINPASLLHIKSTDSGSSDHSAYGHPVTGGQNGALYIDKSNSRIDWQDGIVFAGEGTSWSMRVTGRNGLVTDSDTNGEIFGVHPVEGSGTTWNDTAGADSVAEAYLRVMGNGKTFVDKLYAENSFIAPSHANDTAASSAGGNVAGAIYYNAGSGVHRSYNGTYWANIGVAPITESTFDAFGDGSAICLLKANNSNLDTGGNHNASLSSGVTYTTTSKFGSHSFNTMGNGTYFDIPSLPMVETVSFWHHCVGSNRGYLVDFRHDAPGNGRSYLYTHDGASGGTGQNINMGNDTTTTNRTGVIYIDGVQFSSGAYQFYDGTWYHIVLVRNATDTHRTWDQGLRFGNRSDGTTEGNAGYFDQIRVFNRQLSAAEALSLYNEIA